MKSIKALLLLILVFISCEIPTKPQEIVVLNEPEAIELRWLIRGGHNSLCFCLADYQNELSEWYYGKKIICSEIKLYLSSMVFTYHQSSYNYTVLMYIDDEYNWRWNEL